MEERAEDEGSGGFVMVSGCRDSAESGTCYRRYIHQFGQRKRSFRSKDGDRSRGGKEMKERDYGKGVYRRKGRDRDAV